MDASEKRKLERNRQAEKRREEIKDAAIVEFIEKGIDNSNIACIARRAEVGEATVYRYFENKTNLVIESGAKLIGDNLKILVKHINSENFLDLNGFENVKKIFNMLGSIYDGYPEILRFLEHFDNYVVKENIAKQQLLQYEENFDDVRLIIINAIQKGQKDGSIRPDIDVLQFYTVATHAIVSLSQKLLLRGDIIESDSEIDSKAQISMLIDMNLFFIKSQGG